MARIADPVEIPPVVGMTGFDRANVLREIAWFGCAHHLHGARGLALHLAEGVV